MDTKEAKTQTDLSTMLMTGAEFNAKGKAYRIKPIALKHVDAFVQDNISIDVQLFNLTSKKAREKVNFWLQNYATDDSGEFMSLQKAMDDNWDVVDLKEFFKKLCGLSG
ncbi:MAG: hypothetical protein N2376_01215 [Clostridia bacterium]|nr:hypothetical protein [Clostridia bacterium]